MTEPTTAEEYATAQAAEYGQYVAIAPIDFDGARAYNPGHAVPASNVEKYGYLEGGLVEKVGDDAPTATPPAPTAPVKTTATPITRQEG